MPWTPAVGACDGSKLHAQVRMFFVSFLLVNVYFVPPFFFGGGGGGVLRPRGCTRERVSVLVYCVPFCKHAAECLCWVSYPIVKHAKNKPINEMLMVLRLHRIHTFPPCARPCSSFCCAHRKMTRSQIVCLQLFVLFFGFCFATTTTVVQGRLDVDFLVCFATLLLGVTLTASNT